MFCDVLGFRGSLTKSRGFGPQSNLLHNATLCYDCLDRHYNQGESHNMSGERKCFTLQRCSETQTCGHLVTKEEGGGKE